MAGPWFLQCDNCGEDVPPHDGDSYGEGEETTCECGARLVTSIDDAELPATVHLRWINCAEMEADAETNADAEAANQSQREIRP